MGLDVKSALGAAVEEAKAGFAQLRGDRFHPPPESARFRRVVWGPALVVALARTVATEPALRKRWLKTMLPQLVVAVAAGVLIVVEHDHLGIRWSGHDWKHRLEHGVESTLAFAASLYAAMSIVEWIVIAVARDHHDALSFEVAKHVGVPPGLPVEKPRLKLHVGFVIDTFKKRVHGGAILVVTVAPLVFLALGAVAPLVNAVFGSIGETSWSKAAMGSLPNLVLAAGGAYWLGVFTLGKSEHAWREGAGDPWFLRFIDDATARFPRALGWLHLYGRGVRRLMGVVTRPASIAERASWEALGLVLVRAVLSVPGVYLSLRPLLPVASTIIIAARSPETLREAAS